MPAELWIIAGPNGAGKATLTQAAQRQARSPDVTLLPTDDGSSVFMYEPQVIPAATAAIQGLVTG